MTETDIGYGCLCNRPDVAPPQGAGMIDSARRSARQHPYFVDLYTGWEDHDPLTVGFQDRGSAEAFAASRPEPIIDLCARNGGVVAQRRLVGLPANPFFTVRDDFQSEPYMTAAEIERRTRPLEV